MLLASEKSQLAITEVDGNSEYFSMAKKQMTSRENIPNNCRLTFVKSKLRWLGLSSEEQGLALCGEVTIQFL